MKRERFGLKKRFRRLKAYMMLLARRRRKFQTQHPEAHTRAHADHVEYT